MQLRRQKRPAFFTWRIEHNLTLRATADLLEKAAGYRICSHEQVRVICLPFDDAGRMEPDADLASAIAELTRGECPASSFRPAAAAAA